MVNVQDKIERACEWIESLAADEFPQTKGELGDYEGGFCCLGVAGHLNRDSIQFAPHYGIFEGRGGSVFGLRSRQVQFALGALNDAQGLSFPEIAEMMLRKPRDYFHDEVAEGVEDYFFNGGADQ